MFLVIIVKKKDNKENIKNVKKQIEKNEVLGDAKKIIIITISVLVFIGIFYLLTVFILGKDDVNNDNDNEVEIQFDEILIGTSFSLNDDEYYVLYYETDDDDVSFDLNSVISSYRSADKDLYLYTVDMSNALNSQFSSEKSNTTASKASELQISGPTLIKFSDGKIDKYIEGIDDITDTLK